MVNPFKAKDAQFDAILAEGRKLIIKLRAKGLTEEADMYTAKLDKLVILYYTGEEEKDNG